MCNDGPAGEAPRELCSMNYAANWVPPIGKLVLGTGTTFTRTTRSTLLLSTFHKVQTTSIRAWNVQVRSAVPKSLMKTWTLRKRGSWNKTSVSDKCKVVIGKVSVRGCQGLLKCSMMFQNPQSGSRVIWSTATIFMTRRGCGPGVVGVPWRSVIDSSSEPITFRYRSSCSRKFPVPLEIQVFLRKNGFPHQWPPPSPSPPVGSKGVPETFHNRNSVMRKNSKFVVRGHSLTLSHIKVNHSNVNLDLI